MYSNLKRPFLSTVQVTCKKASRWNSIRKWVCSGRNDEKQKQTLRKRIRDINAQFSHSSPPPLPPTSSHYGFFLFLIIILCFALCLTLGFCKHRRDARCPCRQLFTFAATLLLPPPFCVIAETHFPSSGGENDSPGNFQFINLSV